MRSETREDHEAYGVVSFNNVNGNGFTLTGSTVTHDKCIALTISKACKYSSDYRESWDPEEKIVEVHMSHAQFASAMSSFGSLGVPCTLKQVIREGRKESPPPQGGVNRIQQGIDNQRDRILKKLKTLTAEAEQIMSSKMLKKDKEKLRSILRAIGHEVGSNTEFLHETNQKRLDKMVTDAAFEIEARVTMEAQRIGLQAMSGELKLIDVEGGK